MFGSINTNVNYVCKLIISAQNITDNIIIVSMRNCIQFTYTEYFFSALLCLFIVLVVPVVIIHLLPKRQWIF